MQTICVDFGHSGIKAITDDGQIFLQNLISTEATPADTSSFQGAFNPFDYTVVKYKGRECSLGAHAKHGNVVKQNTYTEDVLSGDSEMLIVASIAQLLRGEYNGVRLLFNLPAAEYRKLKEKIKQTYSNTFKIHIFDYNQNEYIEKSFTVEDIEIKSQGFFSLIDYVFDEDGKEKTDNRDEYRGKIITLDIGYFSTDPLLTNDLKPQQFNIPRMNGLRKSYKNIADELYNEFILTKKPYELEEYIVDNDCTVDFGNKVIDISGPVQAEYKHLVDQIVTEFRNTLDVREIRRWFLTGGGAEPTRSFFEQEEGLRDKVRVIKNPRFANCRGGIKWAKILGWGQNGEE